MTSRSLRERLSGTPRLVLAVVLLAAGVLVALTATAPAAAGPVLVAARGVAAGAVLVPADVVVLDRAVADRPDGALRDPSPALGRRAVAAFARGEVVTTGRLAPRGLTAGLAPGRAVAAVTVAAGRAGVVGVGDTVRLVVAADQGLADPFGAASASATTAPTILADDARVLAVWPTRDGDDTATLVVDVDVGSASRLAVVPADVLVGVVAVTA